MQKDYHSVHPRPLFSPGGGELNLQPNFQKGGGAGQDLTFYRGGAGKEGDDFLQRDCNFHKKNKLKSEIFNDKKS